LATEGLKPDLTLLFDLSISESGARTRRRSEGKHKSEKGDRLDSEDVDFHTRVRAAYLHLAASEPNRFRIVPSDGTVEDTQALVRQIVMPFLQERGHLKRSVDYEMPQRTPA
ncbi:MAG TPA: hypothetical protein VJS64_18110, partial [Pyrinomonadaceae bacterium]|nr:hypothetical protein [Pyrinomonadaceae bacterium]